MHSSQPVSAESPLPYCSDDFPQRLADFATAAEALDYAALAGTGMNFYGADGKLAHALTYAAIRERALALAANLLGLGLERGDRVGIIAAMHPDFVCLFFACQYAGMLAVPLPVVTRLGGRQGYQKQLTQVLETSGARAAFGDLETLPYLQEAAKAAGIDSERVMDTDSLAMLPSGQQKLVPMRADEPSHIQYSSGSTRYPHGIEIGQSALMDNARSIGLYGVGIQRHERIASWLPYYHDMGLIGCLIVPVVSQLTVDYLHTDAFARRPMQWLKMISDNRCTVSFSPTFGYDLCARRMEGKTELGLDLSCWRYAGIGGDMIQPDVFANFARVFAPYGFKAEALMPSYGLAEATLAFSFGVYGQGVTADRIDKLHMAQNGFAKPAVEDSVDATAVRQFACCGKPMPGYEMQIRDDISAALGDRQIGGVFIRCPSLMTGYYNDPEATTACMGDDGWLDTGDMGYRIGDALYITGRRKDMMIVNGRNIWPQDLEWHAEANVPALRARDTAAFSMENEDGREVPVMLVHCRLSGEAERAASDKGCPCRHHGEYGCGLPRRADPAAQPALHDVRKTKPGKGEKGLARGAV